MRGVCTDFPNDRVLGSVFARLDPPAVLAALRDQLDDVPRASRDAWNHIVAVDAAYHPERHVRLTFALLEDPQTPYERYWPEGELVYLHTPVRRPMSRRGRILRLGEVAVEAYRFPDDRRLRGLRKFASSVDAPRQWQRWIDAGDGSRIDPATLQRRFIRYVPEEKWIARLRADVTAPGVGEPVKRRVAIRCCSPEACAPLARRQAAVSEALANSSTIRVPNVVGAETSSGLLAIGWDRGDSLLDSARKDHSVIPRFSAALREFHSSTVPRLPRLTLERVVESAVSHAEELARVCEDRATEITGIAGSIVSQIDTLRVGVPVTLHNDLHLRQVLVKKEQFTFLDLERIGTGDETIDLANLVAQLSILPHRPQDGVDQQTANCWREALLAGWSNAGGEIQERKLAALTVASLLRLAHGAMRHLRPGWRDQLDACLGLAHRALSGPRSPAGVAQC